MRKFSKFATALLTDKKGTSLLELALVAPVTIALAAYGLEMTNLATTNMKVSQAAMALADNMSRVGLESALSRVQIRESDVNDSFIGIQKQTAELNITTGGRIILSSLERNPQNGQWIHWQRCIGTKSVASAYGSENTGATGTSFPGMGPATARVTAPVNQSVMFVEIVYDYKPLFVSFPEYNSTYRVFTTPAKTIRYEQSFIVRDERDLTQIYNPAPAAPVHTCTAFSAT